MKKTEELLRDVLDNLDIPHGVKAEDIPDIGLYMDQVTSFMEENLDSEKRYPEDKVLTKTMINNYTKNHLLPPPDKKKYSRDHILILLLIYYYKNLFSFRDIEQLFKPLTENHFQTGSEISLTRIYDELFTLAEDQTGQLKNDMIEKLEKAETVFEDDEPEDAEYLMMLSFISELFSDIYVKKKVMDYLIDNLAEDNEKREAAAKKKK